MSLGSSVHLILKEEKKCNGLREICIIIISVNIYPTAYRRSIDRVSSQVGVSHLGLGDPCLPWFGFFIVPQIPFHPYYAAPNSSSRTRTTKHHPAI